MGELVAYLVPRDDEGVPSRRLARVTSRAHAKVVGPLSTLLPKSGCLILVNSPRVFHDSSILGSGALGPFPPAKGSRHQVLPQVARWVEVLQNVPSELQLVDSFMKAQTRAQRGFYLLEKGIYAGVWPHRNTNCIFLFVST